MALALPGFGSELPPPDLVGKDDWAAWLVDRLREVDGPVDLGGHV